MTVNELYSYLGKVIRSKHGNYEVVIQNKHGPHCGPMPFLSVSKIRLGIDWDANKIFLIPEVCSDD